MMARVKRRTHFLVAAWAACAACLLVGTAWAGEEKESSPVTSSRALKLSGYTQFLYTAQDEGNDGFSIRRARLSLAGDLLKNVHYKIQFDAVKSPILLDCHVDVAFSDAAGLRLGQFKVPFSQESLLSAQDVDTVNRSQPVTKLSPGQDIGSSGRDIGAILFGKLPAIEYSVGLFNGSGINKADTNEHKDFAGRVVFHPVGFLALGASLYDGEYSAAANSPKTRRDRNGYEFALHAGDLTVRGEFIRAWDGDTTRVGWYVQAGYFLLPGKLLGLIKRDSYDQDTKVGGDRSDLWTFGLSLFLWEKTKLVLNLERRRDEAAQKTYSTLLALFQAAF
jgi:phosphate-selective porin OprO/OprP